MPVSAELYEALMRELEEAEEYIRKSDRRIYASFGGALFIEVSREEALEIIERDRRRIRELLEKLKESGGA